MIYERVIFKGANLGTDFGPIHSALKSLSEKWTFGNSQLHLRNTQGGRKVILDGGSLVIRKMVFFQRISHFKFFHYIKSKKQGLKGSLIHKYFVKWERVCLLLVLKVCIKVCIS